MASGWQLTFLNLCSHNYYGGFCKSGYITLNLQIRSRFYGFSEIFTYFQQLLFLVSAKEFPPSIVPGSFARITDNKQ
ncbi:hypothetical protein [Clostridium aceticum]|uniref:hypothetical protein n=1 Tax=Clostridium aceticum TaxID=84022 RepID=UPI000AC963F4|nr:hypothetical protein [Clostridium aceticum]